jgi:hypothetical protein
MKITTEKIQGFNLKYFVTHSVIFNSHKECIIALSFLEGLKEKKVIKRIIQEIQEIQKGEVFPKSIHMDCLGLFYNTSNIPTEKSISFLDTKGQSIFYKISNFSFLVKPKFEFNNMGVRLLGWESNNLYFDSFPPANYKIKISKLDQYDFVQFFKTARNSYFRASAEIKKQFKEQTGKEFSKKNIMDLFNYSPIKTKAIPKRKKDFVVLSFTVMPAWMEEQISLCKPQEVLPIKRKLVNILLKKENKSKIKYFYTFFIAKRKDWEQRECFPFNTFEIPENSKIYKNIINNMPIYKKGTDIIIKSKNNKYFFSDRKDFPWYAIACRSGLSIMHQGDIWEKENTFIIKSSGELYYTKQYFLKKILNKQEGKFCIPRQYCGGDNYSFLEMFLIQKGKAFYRDHIFSSQRLTPEGVF